MNWGCYRQQWQWEMPPHKCVTRASLKFATFNVWFGHQNLAIRAHNLLGIVRDHAPDIIAFQEVTEPFLKILLATDWVRELYWVSDIWGLSYDSYGTLLLAKVPPIPLDIQSLPSTMDRKLVSADFQINGGLFRVGSVHLESKSEMAAYRERQIKKVFPLMAGTDWSLLMGDFNLCGTSQENEKLPSDYVDLWHFLYPNDAGWTEDTDVNRMLFDLKKRTKQVRYDRILLKCTKPGWQPVQMQLIGTDPVSEELLRTFPSDHFGLVAELKAN